MSLKARVRLICLTTLFASCACAQIIEYPVAQGKARSPDANYELLNRDSDQEPKHSLWLRVRKTGTLRHVLNYERHVQLAWSSDSKSFFVNDYASSTDANCSVINAAGLDSIDVGDLVQKSRNPKPADDGHLYITCKRWRDSKIEIVLSGWGGDSSTPDDKIFLFDPSTKLVTAL